MGMVFIWIAILLAFLGVVSLLVYAALRLLRKLNSN